MDHLLSQTSFMMGRSQMDQGGCYNDMTNMLEIFQIPLLETFLKHILMTGDEIKKSLKSAMPLLCFSSYSHLIVCRGEIAELFIVQVLLINSDTHFPLSHTIQQI